MPQGDPLRPPCGGWSNRSAKFNIGCGHERTDYDDGITVGHPLGWPVRENTTKVVGVVSGGEISPCTVYPKDDGDPTPAHDCFYETNPYARKLNTYALKSPAEYVKHGACKHKGFKVVYAKKAWHGRRGFTEPCLTTGPFSQTKYRTLRRWVRVTRVRTYCEMSDPITGEAIGSVVTTTVFEKELISTVNRYTGQVIYTVCEGELPGDDSSNDWFGIDHCGTSNSAGWTGNGGVATYLNETALVPCNVTFSKSTSNTELAVTWFEDMPQCGNQKQRTLGFPLPCGGMTEYPFPGVCMSQREMDAHGCEVCESECTQVYNCCEDHVGPGSDTIDILISLSDPYTATQVQDDCDTLLATWDLCDDVLYPWRTDVPFTVNAGVTCGGNYWQPQAGPGYGPLVTYDEALPTGPGSGCDDVTAAEDIKPTAILGAPIQYYIGGSEPAEYPAWWDFERKNVPYEVLCEPMGICGWKGDDPFPARRPGSWGGASPFKNATQWTPDWLNNQFMTGHVQFYNAPYFYYQETSGTCAGETMTQVDRQLWSGHLVKSKYAEVYLHAFPSHNYARPCGAEDRAAVDPEFQDCDCLVPLVEGECPDEQYTRYPLVWPRDARWPNAATPTENIPNSNKGSDVSCYCNRYQAEKTVDEEEEPLDPHVCDANANPEAQEKVLTPPDTDSGNTATKTNYGYDDDSRKGDYSLKKWVFDPLKALNGATNDILTMECISGCFGKKGCGSPAAVFIQTNAPTGKYAGALHVAPARIALRDETGASLTGYIGFWLQIQFDQAMVDPLYKEPQEPCGFEGTWTAPEKPLEENRHCGDGHCVDYVANIDGGAERDGRCEPVGASPWTRVED